MRPEVEALIARSKELEARSMGIYVRLAAAFPDNTELREFWMSMARHEAGHVGALELFAVLLQNSADELSVSDQSGQQLEEAEATIEALYEEAGAGVTVERAFEIALDLEGSELEDLVLDLIGCLGDAPQRDQAEKMLLHDLSDLSLMIEKYSHDEELLARADQLVETRVSDREGRSPVVAAKR